MVRVSFLTKKEREETSAFREEGMTSHAIAKNIKRHPNSVKQYLAHPPSYESRSRTAGNIKLTIDSHLSPVREANKGQKSASQLKVALQLPIIKQWVQQILSAQSDIQFRMVEKALQLTNFHKENRLRWEWKRHTWSRQQWGKVDFADEKKN